MHLYHEDREKIVEINTDKKTLLVGVKVGGEVIWRTDLTFLNLTVLSEHFRDEVGLGPALQILTDNKIGADSPLWTLGAKGGDSYGPRK